MTHQQLMAMSKEQLVQAYEELQDLYARQMASLNSTVSNNEDDFAIVKAKLMEEITTLKTENAVLVKKNEELIQTITALKAEK